MLKHLIAVLTASVSFAGCNTGPSGTPANQTHTVNRPITEPEVGPRGAPVSHSGSTTTTQPADTANAEAGSTATASGVGEPGPGSTAEGSSARGNNIDAAPARGTSGP